MLGHDLIPCLRERGHEVTGIDLEVDIRDRMAVEGCVAELVPEGVIHAAAWTDVDAAEANEAAAYAVNADGARNVARAAARAGAALVYVSTDYVFDGTLDRDYTEDDPTAPIDAYGRTKRAGEVAVREEHPTGARIARTARSRRAWPEFRGHDAGLGSRAGGCPGRCRPGGVTHLDP